MSWAVGGPDAGAAPSKVEKEEPGRGRAGIPVSLSHFCVSRIPDGIMDVSRRTLLAQFSAYVQMD